jgi:Family of unknown function (DUF6152)
MRSFLLFVAFIVFVSGPFPPVAGAAAHHGTAASYDQEAWITVEGVVREFYWRNPHSALFLEVSDENGETSEYGVELASPTLMVQQGYNRNIFKAGDRVEIRVHPSKTGSAVGECLFSCQILVNGEEPEQDRQ